MPSIYIFLLSFIPSLFQVYSMKSSLYGKSLPWPTSLQRNRKVSERFLVLSMCKIAIPRGIAVLGSRCHIVLVLASTDKILGSKDIYLKRAFQRCLDCTDPTVGLRVMTILILLTLKNPKIIIHIWKLLC